MTTISDAGISQSPKRALHELAEPTYPGKVFSPAVDIYETKDAITVVADVPGVKAENLCIDLEDNVLTLAGRISEAEQTFGSLLLQEYLVGSYYRRFSVSDQIDQEKIDASLKDGVVRIVLPKVNPAIPRRIAIRTE